MPADNAPVWKITRGRPTPEELAALTVVLTVVNSRLSPDGERDATVVSLPARWEHPTTPATAQSWQAA